MRILSVVLLCLFLSSCSFFTSEEKVRRALNVICKSDLQQMVNDSERKLVKKDPYFEIVEYKTFDSDSSVYTVLATVDFHYMDQGTEVNYKIVRKYRYHYIAKKWQRFYNEFESIQYKK